MFIILLLSILLSVQAPASPIVIGHRGASFYAPEGTKPSYELAITQQADYLEADIQRSKDGILFVFHDKNLKRTTDVVKKFPSRRNKNIKFFTLKELKGLDAGSWFNKEYPERSRKDYAGIKLLTLDEFLNIAKGKNIYLETKNPKWHPGIEKDLYLTLKKRKWLKKQNIILQTFDQRSLLLLNKYMPDISKCFLLHPSETDLFGQSAWANRHGAEYIGIPIELYSKHISKKVHSLGLGIHVFTVNDVIELKVVQGEDGIFTNVPDIAGLIKKFPIQ